jgi:hypothetical protein
MTPSLYFPVIDTFLRGLPYTFSDVDASVGTALLIEVAGDCGGQWCLVRSEDRWRFTGELPANVEAHVVIPQAIAWRLFTKGIDRESALAEITISGDTNLGGHILELTAIVG